MALKRPLPFVALLWLVRRVMEFEISEPPDGCRVQAIRFDRSDEPVRMQVQDASSLFQLTRRIISVRVVQDSVKLRFRLLFSCRHGEFFAFSRL